MENYITFFAINFIVDLVLCFTLKKMFKLSCSKLGVFFLQILNICASAIYLFLELKFYEFVLLKIVADFVICLIITDSYKFSKILILFATSLLIMFSYYGFSKFIIKFVQSIFNEVFCIKLPYFCDFLIIFALFCYVFAIFALIHKLSKNKNLKTFLRKVSFLAFGKHIEIVGFIDTGNVLYDTKTKLPVIVLKCDSLKNFLPSKIYKNITNGNFSKLGVSHYIKCVSVAGKQMEIPIINIKKATISDGCDSKTFECVIGIVNHRFENSNEYDCLLHRDFV